MIFKIPFKISFWIVSVFLTISSCENEPYEGVIPEKLEIDFSCDEAIKKVSDAAIDFSFANEFNYSEVCGMYQTAIQNQIEVCGDNDGRLKNLMDSLGNCTLEIVEALECGNFPMSKVYEEQIACDYSLFGKLQVVNVYMEGKDFLSDRDEDGINDHFGKLIYVTDGTVITNSQNEFMSFKNHTYILELLLESNGTQRLIPGLYKLFGSEGLNSDKESFLAGGHFGSKLSAFDKFQNGVVYLSELEGKSALCFDILIDNNANCFSGSYEGIFKIVYF